MITAREINERLARQTESVCAMLLPAGKRKGREWCVGSTGGEEGESLKVVLSGEKAGLWKDFSSGQAGDLLDLWASVRGTSIGDAIRDARDYLGIALPAFTGTPRSTFTKPAKPVGVTKPKGDVLTYLHGRGLTDESIAAYRVAANADDDEVVFPFMVGGELVNMKRIALARVDGKKQVRQEKGAEPCLFGWQAIPGRARTVVICEGEIDAMTWWQMGFPALSAWSGAGNHQWIENDYDRLAQFDRIYIAFDNDDAGNAGAAAVVDRLGRVRCRVVSTVYKDANECLTQGCDREAFREMIDAAASSDPKELRSGSSYRDEVMAKFFPPEGTPPTGWETPFGKLSDVGARLDEAQLVILNGINGHGKTKLLGQLGLSLIQQGAKVCSASMEVKPAKLLHAMTIQAAGQREPSKEYAEAIQRHWNGRLWLFDALGTVKADYLLDVFRYARACYGVRVFVIDSLAKCGFAEDDYNGQKRFVEALCDFKNESDSLVFLVTHSRKLESETRVVDKMDIKGTGAIADLADVITTLWRNKAKEAKAKPVGDAQAQEHDAEPDARWYWQKNRDGEWEGRIPLWYHRESFQFVEGPHTQPRAFVPYRVTPDLDGLPADETEVVL